LLDVRRGLDQRRCDDRRRRPLERPHRALPPRGRRPLRAARGHVAARRLRGDGVAAEDAIYQRLHADLDAIRAANPALADNRFGIPWWLPHELSITGL